MAKEAEIQKAILAWLRLKGYVVWRNYVGPILRGKQKIPSPNPMAGMPDICGLLKDGRLFAIEVKRPGGKVSPKQVKWITTLQDAGAVAFIARDLDTVRERLDSMSESVKKDSEMIGGKQNPPEAV